MSIITSAIGVALAVWMVGVLGRGGPGSRMSLVLGLV